MLGFTHANLCMTNDGVFRNATITVLILTSAVAQTDSPVDAPIVVAIKARTSSVRPMAVVVIHHECAPLRGHVATMVTVRQSAMCQCIAGFGFVQRGSAPRARSMQYIPRRDFEELTGAHGCGNFAVAHQRTLAVKFGFSRASEIVVDAS